MKSILKIVQYFVIDTFRTMMMMRRGIRGNPAAVLLHPVLLFYLPPKGGVVTNCYFTRGGSNQGVNGRCLRVYSGWSNCAIHFLFLRRIYVPIFLSFYEQWFARFTNMRKIYATLHELLSCVLLNA